MKTLETIFKRLVFLPIGLRISFTGLSAVLLLAVYLKQINHTLIASLIYSFSAYTLGIVVTALVMRIQRLRMTLHHHPIVMKYNQQDVKAELSLYLSLAVSLVYSLYKAFVGVYAHSWWFGSVACYYIILSIARFLLLHHIRKRTRNELLELKKYDICGKLLLILTICIIFMSVDRIYKNTAVRYPGHMIYAAAAFTFYNFTIAIINSIRYRASENLMYHASKMLTLATALVSVFSLQNNMFAEFGGDPIQQRIMNSITGFFVFIITIGIALSMIIRAKTRWKQTSACSVL